MAPTYAAPATRRRRWPLVLLIIVLLLVGAAVAADRVALALAEDKAASALQNSEHLSHKPDVSVEGFPFLTQLAAGSFDEVVVTANDVSVGANRSVQIQRVRVDLHHVTLTNNYRTVHAQTATADGSIGYDELSQALHTPVHGSPDGRLVATPTVHVFGQTFHGTVSAVVHASSARGITFTDPKVTVAGVTLPDAASRALAGVFTRVISLSGLPFHVRVTGAAVTSSALVVKLAGDNLTYQR